MWTRLRYQKPKPLYRASSHIYLILTELKNPISIPDASAQVSDAAHLPCLSHAFIDPFLRPEQSTSRISSPSTARITSPTLTSSGLLQRKYPPRGPRKLFMMPAFLSLWNICSMYRAEIFCLSEMSFIWITLPVECDTMSQRDLTPYSICVVSFTLHLSVRRWHCFVEHSF